MSRLIAVKHRVKKTAAGEAHPTLVTLVVEGQVKDVELATEQDELDFVNGEWPVAYRAATPEDKAGRFKPWHVKWKEKDGERFIHQVPRDYDGLRKEDVVLMQLGGSGDRLAAAMARKLFSIDGMVCRVPPHLTKSWKGEREISDNLVLLEIWEKDSGVFNVIDGPELERIAVREAYENRGEAQRARIGCEQRLHQRQIGTIFVQGDLNQQIALEDSFEALRASSPILDALCKEEAQATRLLEKAVRGSRPWQLFEPIEGVGPAIAGALIAGIGDIRRFASWQKLCSFAGLSPLDRDGKRFGKGSRREAGDSIFPRRRRGQLSNWNQSAKQALFLLGDQFNRRPNSYWGAKLKANKVSLRLAHPEIVIEEGKKRFTDGHIHKRAIWKTLVQFIRWLWRAWMNLEAGKPVKFPQFPQVSEEAGAEVAKAA